MALFGKDKKEKDTEKKTKESSADDTSTNVSVATAKRVDNSNHDVLVKPLITEKATYMTDDGIYAFVVRSSANKPQIKQAVKDVYGVDVVKVRTVTLPAKQVPARSRRAKPGTKGGLKKAYVHLKDGDSIELM
ncbi:MAG: 50S ribosomal protein L23 [Candidatus Paceibacterota bacterium]